MEEVVTTSNIQEPNTQTSNISNTEKGSTSVSSIWGDGIDIEEIPDNPFHVEPGTYQAVCTEATIKVSEDKTKTGLSIVWTIDEPDQAADGAKVREYFAIYPGRDYSTLEAGQKKGLSFFMLRLRRGFDLSTEQIKKLEPEDLIGAKSFITTENRDSTKEDENGNKTTMTFPNVKSAVCPRILAEENGTGGSNSASGLGLDL